MTVATEQPTSLRMWNIPIPVLKIHRSTTLVTTKPSTVKDERSVSCVLKEVVSSTSAQNARLHSQGDKDFCFITERNMDYPVVLVVLFVDICLDRNATCFSIWIHMVMPEPTSVFVGSRSSTDPLLWDTTTCARITSIKRVANLCTPIFNFK